MRLPAIGATGIALVIAFAAACSGGGTSAGSTSSTAPSSAASNSTASTTPGARATAPVGTAPGSTTPGTATRGTAARDGSTGTDENEPPDLLTIASGAVVVSSNTGAQSAAGKGLRAIDGDPERIAITNDTGGPVEFVYQLPAPTTFERFAVPAIKEAPGNATFFKNIEVSGSAESATAGFTTLVSDALPAAGAEEREAELTPKEPKSVRWIKLRLDGTQQVEPRHEPGSTNVEFTELIGNGKQDDVPLSDRFTGKWDFRFSDAPERAGPTLELKQQGSAVSGCYDTTSLTGNVTGSIARLQGHDSKSNQDSVYLFTVAETGELQGVESTNGGVFRARVGPVAATGASSPCSDVAPKSLTCDSIVYINFDVDSAVIRPDSQQVITDVYEGLKAEPAAITLAGHTSTEGSAEHNLDLSTRRAQAVVDALVAKGLDRAKVKAEGKGETQPLVTEKDESSRALNRRVQIECG